MNQKVLAIASVVAVAVLAITAVGFDSHNQSSQVAMDTTITTTITIRTTTIGITQE